MVTYISVADIKDSETFRIVWRTKGWVEVATVFLNERTGHISISSGFGDYAYCWPRSGHESRSLKEFLLDVGMDYFMGKCRGGEWHVFDFDASLATVRQYVTEAKKHGDISGEVAHEAYVALRDIHSIENDGAFADRIWSDRDIAKALGEDYFDVCKYRPDPEAVAFWEEMWPDIRRELRRRANRPLERLRNWWIRKRLSARRARERRHIERIGRTSGARP